MRELVERLAESVICISDNSFRSDDKLPNNLQEGYKYFLSVCDGGYTTDHFFHFFGQKGPRQHNLLQWNRSDLWKKYYGLGDDTFVFAEDIFGTQFCFDVRGDRRVVKMLIPDGGRFSLCTNSFEEFLQAEVLSDERNLAARQLCQRFFEKKREPWRPFTHIACKIPPSLGGNDSDVDNLEVAGSSTNLKLLGQIKIQIEELPVGTRIRDVRIDYDKEEITLIPAKHIWRKRLS